MLGVGFLVKAIWATECSMLLELIVIGKQITFRVVKNTQKKNIVVWPVVESESLHCDPGILPCTTMVQLTSLHVDHDFLRLTTLLAFSIKALHYMRRFCWGILLQIVQHQRMVCYALFIQRPSVRKLRLFDFTIFREIEISKIETMKNINSIYRIFIWNDFRFDWCSISNYFSILDVQSFLLDRFSDFSISKFQYLDFRVRFYICWLYRYPISNIGNPTVSQGNY